ncbi:unnamed protein product, partial [Laminaria digitata]
MALKLDEGFAQGALLPRLLFACGLHERDDRYRLVAKAMEELEWRFCTSVNFSVLPETPMTFLHHFIARVVSVGVLHEAHTARIGERAGETALTWLR